MSFLAPGYLWLLLAVAASAVGYVALQRRRRHNPVSFTRLKLLAALAPEHPGSWQHVPAAVMVLALAGLVMGLARPARTVLVPQKATVVLAIDVPKSMEATDVAPSRIEAARSAALDLVEALPAEIRVGLVTFAARARVRAEPTSDRPVLRASLQALKTGFGTAAGEALIAAIDSIIDSRRATDTVSNASGSPPKVDRIEGAAIVLLSDGDTKSAAQWSRRAATVAERGVPVFTIVFGTDAGTVNRAAMMKVAEITRGTFFEATSGEELRAIYKSLGTQISREHREFGMTLVGGALALLVLAFAGSLWWNSRTSERS